MSPTMLHSKKSQSILQWFNSLTAKGDVNSLAQFTDGSHFYEIVASLQPYLHRGIKEGNLASESVIFSETSIACNEEVITSVEGEAVEVKMETSVTESGDTDPFVVKESDHTDTQKKYDVIRKFIDEFYHVESSSLIDYKECPNGNQLELAKVAVFLLSAMVQNLLSAEDKVVYNTTLLEPEVQENIRECLSLVLVDKDSGENQIKKSDIHKVLSHPASFKGTPIRKQPSRSISDGNDLTEGVKNVPKKRKERTSVIVYEDVQDSPLKNLLESPKIQYKAAIFRKDSELVKLRSALHNEENKVMDLALEKKNLNNELEKRRKELEFYKKELESQRQAFGDKEEQERLREEELKMKKLEDERIKKLIESQEEEIKQLREDNEALLEKIAGIERNLEKDATFALIEENNNLKEQIQILEVENEKKSEIIKTLNEKVGNLENDLKMYQQMVQDFSAPVSRRELRSPHVPESLSTIIYADGQSSREAQDLRQDLETKDERVKRLGPQRKGDTSKNKNRNVESLQVTVDHLHSSVRSLEKERDTLKEKLEYYESKFGSGSDDAYGSRDLNSVKNEADKIGSVLDDVSEISASCNNKKDYKVEGQLWAHVSDESQHSKPESVFVTPQQMAEGKTMFDKSTLVSIIRQLERKNCAAPSLLKTLRENCNKIKDSHEFSAHLRDLLQALKLPASPSVTTRRSRSLAAEEVETNSLANKNHILEQEILTLKQNLKLHRTKASKKEDELRLTNKNLEISNASLSKEIDNLKQEIAVIQEKYINMEKLAKKKDDDVKKALVMFQRIQKKSLQKKECGEECEALRSKLKELNEECLEFEQETAELKIAHKDLEGQVQNLRHQVKELSKEKKELQHRLWLETSALSNNIADRDAVVRHYFSNSKHEPPKATKDLQLRKREESRKSLKPLMKVTNTVYGFLDNDASMSNSVFANSSIRSGFFQAADEDDFLNESSLAEIQNGGILEDASAESRLQEIRRRNTLCPPHLQSSYPLEIQDMTPSEKKYFDAEEVSFDLGRKSSLYVAKEDLRRKPNSKYVEKDSDDSDDSRSFLVKKRKLAETNRIPAPASKKQCRPSAKIIEPKEKSLTPLKRAANFVRKRSTFKTPVSVHRLMSISRKNKAQ